MREVDFAAADGVWRGFPEIVAVWAFGSGQDGVVRSGSDLDLAVLFDSSPHIDRLAELRATLQDALHLDDIDLLVLNSAGSISGFEAISGRSLFCRDKGRRAEFVSGIARQYEDDMAFLDRGLRVVPQAQG